MKYLMVGGPGNGEFFEPKCGQPLHPVLIASTFKVNKTKDGMVEEEHLYRRETVAHGNNTISIIYVWEGLRNIK